MFNKTLFKCHHRQGSPNGVWGGGGGGGRQGGFFFFVTNSNRILNVNICRLELSIRKLLSQTNLLF